jgi:hypothetical protein
MISGMQAWAIDGTIPFTNIDNWAGTCRTLAVRVDETKTAWVSLGPSNFTPDGNRFRGDLAEPSNGTLTPSYIESTCNLSSVINFTADGANGLYVADNYIGFSFRGTDNTTGLTYDYEFAHSGASGTTFINTRTLVDSTSPTVSLSGAPVALNGTTPFDINVTFSEDVTGFIASDITVSGGSVTNLTGGPANYVATIAPDSSTVQEITVSIAAAVAADAAAKDNTASNTLKIGNNTLPEDTLKLISSFMLERANNLAANQPQLSHFLIEQNRNDVNAFATEEHGGNIKASVQVNKNVWIETSGAWTSSDKTDNKYFLGSVGSHAQISENVLLGAMIQTDYAKSTTDKDSVSGTGWLAGPYIVAKHPDHPLYFEGRLLYGQSENDISPLGTFTDSFDSERFLGQARVTGNLDYDTVKVLPYADITYTEDKQKSYTDSVGNIISSQTVNLTQIKSGVDVQKSIDIASGMLVLSSGFEAIYSETGGSAPSTITPEYENMRGRLDLGVDYLSDHNSILKVSTFYDGIGASDYEGYGINITYEKKF